MQCFREKVIETSLHLSENKQAELQFLLNQGLSMDTIMRFHIGYDEEMKSYTVPIISEEEEVITILHYQLSYTGKLELINTEKPIELRKEGILYHLRPAVLRSVSNKEPQSKKEIYVLNNVWNAMFYWQKDLAAISSFSTTVCSKQIRTLNKMLYPGTIVKMVTRKKDEMSIKGAKETQKNFQLAHIPFKIL